MSLKQIFFSHRGRMGKNAYWIHFSIVVALYVCFLILPLYGMYKVFPEKFTWHYIKNISKVGLNDIDFMLIFSELTILCLLTGLMLYSATVMSIKRLHDRDKSGWWLVPFFVLPTVLEIIAEYCSRIPHIGISIELFLYLISYLFYIGGYIELSFLNGDKGRNRYDLVQNYHKIKL